VNSDQNESPASLTLRSVLLPVESDQGQRAKPAVARWFCPLTAVH